jgi:hypothetical protein
MLVNVTGRDGARTYHVPMTYRGAPLVGADAALIGQAAHGVLGRRWIYDGDADPVLRDQLTRLLRGDSLPQHQSRSNEVDNRVRVSTTTDVDEAARAGIVRVLQAGGVPPRVGVTATWTAPDGSAVTGTVVAAG